MKKRYFVLCAAALLASSCTGQSISAESIQSESSISYFSSSPSSFSTTPSNPTFLEKLEQARGLTGQEREQAGRELYLEARENGLFKPMGFSTQKRHARYFDALEFNPGFGLGYRRLDAIISVNEMVKANDYEASIKANLTSRQEALDFIEGKGYTVKDESVFYGEKSSFDLLNVYAGRDRFESAIITANRGLFRQNPLGKIENDLAEKVIVSDDGLTYNITIGEHYWKDASGNRVSRILASDFVYMLDSIKSLNSQSSFYGTHIDSFEAVSETELKVVAKHKDAEFLSKFISMTNYPLPKAQRADNHLYGSDLAHTVFSGDYTLSMDGEDLVLSATKDGLNPTVRIKPYTISSDGFEQGIVDEEWLMESDGDDYALPNSFDSSIIVQIDPYGHCFDKDHQKAAKNTNFRFALLSALLRDNFENYTSTSIGIIPSVNPFNALANPDSQDALPFDDDGMATAKRYFEAAKKELGSSFFSAPVELAIEYYGDEEHLPDYILAIKETVANVFGEDVAVVATGQPLNRYYGSLNCFFSVGALEMVNGDLLDALETIFVKAS